MTTVKTIIKTPDNYNIPVYFFKNTLNLDIPKANIQLIHGMCEHKDYYLDFIKYFTNLGYNITIHDHRGHGSAVENISDLGVLAEEDGGQKLISDSILVTKHIKQQNPNIDLVLLGHSMGALIAQSMLMQDHKENKNNYSILLLTGSPGYTPAIECSLGKLLIKFEILRQKLKKHAISPTTSFLLNYVFNFSFRKEHKPFAWITKDNKWLDKFLADPRASYVPPNQFWLDLIYLLERVKNKKKYQYIKSDFPIVFLDGAVDPVNFKTNFTKKLIKKLNKIGIKNIKHLVYPNTRHHLCIEANRDVIFADINKLITGRLG